jgi:hypothetical protein
MLSTSASTSHCAQNKAQTGARRTNTSSGMRTGGACAPC